MIINIPKESGEAIRRGEPSGLCGLSPSADGVKFLFLNF